MNGVASPGSEADRLAPLVEGQLKGQLSLEQKTELAELLDSSAESQRRFVELATFETALAEVHRNPSPAFSFSDHASSSFATWTRRILPWIAAAACVALVFWPRMNDAPSPSKDAVGMLVNWVDAEFGASRTTQDTHFDRGSYELIAGTIHLRFSNGTDLVIEGPAKFELIDALRARLDYGIVRAIVPPAAKGFTIVTRSAHFEDVGTEFGLRVERETGKESLLVFDGQVNVRRPDSNALVSSVRVGEAFEYENGVGAKPESVQPQVFPAPDAIGVRHWRSKTEARLSDSSLIALYSFERDANQIARVRNLRSQEAGAVSDAEIHGARWGSGRWQGKDALLFDGKDQFAELHMEGEFKSLTLAAWVKVNRLDHTLFAVFDSNGWESGDIHLQIQRHGTPYADHYEARGGKKKYWDVMVPMTEWTHLVATYSATDRKMQVFANGKLAYECDWVGEGRIRPGACRIGNWLAVGEHTPGAPAGSFLQWQYRRTGHLESRLEHRRNQSGSEAWSTRLCLGAPKTGFSITFCEPVNG